LPSALANIAAAVSAGYSETVLDRGASHVPAATRYTVTLEKHLSGDSSAGAPWRAYGQGATQGDAETQALAGLNKQRDHRYAGTTGPRGGTLTVDTT
jgi:hypothetical protein